MEIIARPRGTGKTRELLTKAHLANAQVLTTNKRALQAKAQAYGLIGMTILDWNDMLEDEFNPERPLYIHKVDDVMTELFNNEFYGLKLDAISLTLEDNNAER